MSACLPARALGVLAATAVAAAGCSGPPFVTEPSAVGLPPDAVVRAPPDAGREHHADGHFRNPPSGPDRPSGLRVAWWIASRRVLARPFRGADPPAPSVPLDPGALRTPPERLRATWLGHATLYVQTPEASLLLDPVFSRVAGPVAFAGPDRRVPLPLRPEDLPGVDVVLISHDHYDHLDRASVRALAERFDPVFLVPLGVGAAVRAWGATRVAELDWWHAAEWAVGAATLRFTCTPAAHDSGRRLGAFRRTLWAGWYVERDRAGDVPLAVFYAGDTAYGPHVARIRERLGPPDVAVLPIGAYAPRAMTAASHMTPEEALRAFVDLGGAEEPPPGRTRALVPVHWGTFELTDERLAEPPARLEGAAGSAALGARVHVLPVGGVFEAGRAGKGGAQR